MGIINASAVASSFRTCRNHGSVFGRMSREDETCGGILGGLVGRGYGKLVDACRSAQLSSHRGCPSRGGVEVPALWRYYEYCVKDGE